MARGDLRNVGRMRDDRRRLEKLVATERTNQLPKVIAGVRFVDGIEVTQTTESRAA